MNHVSFDYSGTSVLVTGGTSGIGHAVATAFADSGATVVVTGTRSSAEDYDVDLARFGYRHLDLADADGIEGLPGTLDRLDILVNNAGATFPGGRDEWTPDGFAAALDVNLLGAVRLTTGCAPLLVASGLPGGAGVLNLTSMTAFRGTDLVPGYASAKAGIVTWTANLARRWAQHGVRVNAIAPGVIETPMTAPMALIPEIAAAELAHIPAGRFGTVDEVAATALFLCSAAAAYITGATVAVDGGYLAG